MTTRTKIAALLLVSAALALATVSLALGQEAPQTDPAAAAPNVVTITATEYAFHAPDTIPAGWTTVRFVNHGEKEHMAQLVRLEDGHTLGEFRHAYHEAWRTDGPRPAWGIRSGGPGVAGGGEITSATLNLEPGNYGLYCAIDVEDGVPHVFGRAMARPLVVVPSGDETTRQAAPVPTVTIRMTDYAFALETPLTPGRHVIRVANTGAEPHELALVKLPPGATREALEAWLRTYVALGASAKSGTGERDEPAAASAAPESTAEQGPDSSTLGGIVALAPGLEGYFEVDVTPGEYALLCFVTAPDGRPHVAHGMVQYLRVG